MQEERERLSTVCYFVLETRLMKAAATDAIVEIRGDLNCRTLGIIYCITCKKCMMQYIGTSKLTAQARLSQHADYIRNKNLTQPLQWEGSQSEWHEFCDSGKSFQQKPVAAGGEGEPLHQAIYSTPNTRRWMSKLNLQSNCFLKNISFLLSFVYCT